MRVSMARPIRNTPILMGKDADEFLRKLSVLPSEEERRRERARVEHNARQLFTLISKVKAQPQPRG